MPGTHHLVEFILASAAIILVPGPSVMFVIARAIAWGRATAFMTAVGNALGMIVLSTVIAIGLGPLLQRSHALLEVVQVLGGLYLVYLGRDALRHREEHANDMVTVTGTKPQGLVTIRQGFTVGVLNPKALVFFSAVFPQFVDEEAGSLTFQLLMFGVIFAVLALLMDGTWGLLVGSSRDWFANSQGRLVALRTMGGVVMCGLGVLVIIPVALAHLRG